MARIFRTLWMNSIFLVKRVLFFRKDAEFEKDRSGLANRKRPAGKEIEEVTEKIAEDFEKKIKIEKADQLKLILEKPAARQPKRQNRFVSSIITAPHRIFCWIVYRVWKAALDMLVDIKVEGKENLPEDMNALIVSNHSSYLDVPVVAYALYGRLIDISWVISKSNYDLWILKIFFPAFKPIITGGGATEKIKGELKINRSVVLFPEGNEKWCPPSEAAKKKASPPKGVAVIAASTGATIIPIGISGADKALPARQSFKLDRRYTITVRIGKPLSFEKVDGDKMRDGLLADIRQDVMNRIYSLVEKSK